MKDIDLCQWFLCLCNFVLLYIFLAFLHFSTLKHKVTYTVCNTHTTYNRTESTKQNSFILLTIVSPHTLLYIQIDCVCFTPALTATFNVDCNNNKKMQFRFFSSLKQDRSAFLPLSLNIFFVEYHRYVFTQDAYSVASNHTINFRF